MVTPLLLLPKTGDLKLYLEVIRQVTGIAKVKKNREKQKDQ